MLGAELSDNVCSDGHQGATALPVAAEAPLAIPGVSDEKRLELLFDAVIDYAIHLLNPAGNVSSWNAGAERIKGYRATEIIGRHFSVFYTDEDRRNSEPARSLAVATAEGKYEREGWRVRKDGTRFWANVVIVAIRDEQGQLVGFAKVTRDITERREAQETLEQTRAALAQSQKIEAIGRLTGGIAHDFNNLLTVVSTISISSCRMRVTPCACGASP